MCRKWLVGGDGQGHGPPVPRNLSSAGWPAQTHPFLSKGADHIHCVMGGVGPARAGMTSILSSCGWQLPLHLRV